MLITAPERASIKDFVPDQAIVPRLFTRSDPDKTAKNETMKNQNLPNDKTLPMTKKNDYHRAWHKHFNSDQLWSSQCQSQ
jgi:hypothetical protein